MRMLTLIRVWLFEASGGGKSILTEKLFMSSERLDEFQ